MAGAARAATPSPTRSRVAAGGAAGRVTPPGRATGTGGARKRAGGERQNQGEGRGGAGGVQHQPALSWKKREAETQEAGRAKEKPPVELFVRRFEPARSRAPT